MSVACLSHDILNGYIIVEKGDTLGAIATKLGKSTREMMALNPAVKSANKIAVGQKLKSATRLPKPKMPEVPSKTISQESMTKSPSQELPQKSVPAPTKKEEVSKAIEETPNEPVSHTKNAGCCCKLEKLQIVQQKRGANSEGKGGSTYTMDVVKLQEKRNVAKPTNKEKGTFELYITAPLFKSDGTPDIKSLSFPHGFHKPKCDLEISLKSERMEKVAKDEIKINSYSFIEGAVDRKPPKDTYHNPNPRAHKSNFSYKNEWNITKLLKLATAQEGLYEVYDVLPKGSTKCNEKKPLGTLYVAKAMKLDGEAKLSYTGEHDVKTTGLLGEWEAKAKSKIESKLTLTFLADTYEFNDSYTTGMSIPKGGKGTLHTVPTKELFGNFAQWFDPVYSIVTLAKEAPSTHKGSSSSLGATTLSLKATDFQYTEKPSDYTLTPTGSIELGINVFDGSELRIDMIPAITKSIDALNEVVSTATSHSVHGEVKADLILRGSISGACKLETKADTFQADTSATIGAEVTVGIEAKIEAEAKWLFFHVKAGAHATLASEKSIDVGAGIKGELTFAAPKKPNDPIDFNGDILCTGAAIYLGVYAQGGVYTDKEAGTDTAGESGDIYNSSDSEQSAQDTSSQESGLKVERSCNFVILHEFSFKEVLLNNKKAPPLRQYHTQVSAVDLLTHGIT